MEAHLIKEVINIRIEKQKVLTTILHLCERTKHIVHSLYTGDGEFLTVKCSVVRELIESNQKGKKHNPFNMLSGVRGATGVYLFIDNDGVPVYIGKGGTGKKDDLAIRVRNECKIFPCEDTGATLSKNIKGQHKLLNQELGDSKVACMIRELEVTVINVGKMTDSDSQSFAAYLESLLLLLFKPKYNKQG